ncbi:MAG: collagen-binding domain-containing protein, partial [Brooklawnia sp.]
MAAVLVAGGLTATVPAVADTTTFNPFVANNGFSIVATGNATIGNNEIEGSIAAFGSIEATTSNFPLVHKVAGVGDYAVPTVDGDPVRILAGSFVGTGNIAVTNAGHEGSPGVSDAIAKLASIDGLQGGPRGDWLRVSNSYGSSDQGNLDLEALKLSTNPTLEGNVKTEHGSVADYFEGLGQQVEQTNSCLLAMYGSELATRVQVQTDGGMVSPSGFSSTQPNYLDYSEVAGKIIKQDKFGGYVPTAAAPLVIRVADGTTTLGQVNVEGWSSSAGAQQTFSRYIMFDLSQVTNPVTINGLEMGAIWAPNSDVTFDSNVTHNGQIFAGGNFTSRGAGELHHHTFMGALPCGASDPWIGTTVSVPGSEGKVVPFTGGTLVDTVA